MSNDSPTGAESFQDPLENYDPKTYDDRLEAALMEETVAAIQATPYITIPPDMPVEQAIKQLVGQCVSCALVAKEDRLVGIFSDRDALDQAALEYETVKDQPVSQIMTTNPISVHEDDSTAAALSVMAAVGYRHVPVLNAEEKVVGIVSPVRIVDFLKEYFHESN